MRLLNVNADNAGQRLDKYLFKYMNTAPRSFVYKMLRKKNIKLNGKKAEGNEIISPGDEITLFLADETIDGFRRKREVRSFKEKPDIIYEDENIIIVNKPVGMLSQAEKKGDRNLNDIILYYLSCKGEYTPASEFKPGIVSRLDRNTSGITLMGKNFVAQQELSLVFREHTVKKIYLLVAEGVIEKQGEIELLQEKVGGNMVVTGRGKRAVTKYTPLSNNGSYTIVRAELITGRTHQIRAGFAQMGHPLVGDIKYGGKSGLGLKFQALHAYSLTFSFKGGRLGYLDGRTFKAEPQGKFKEIIKKLK